MLSGSNPSAGDGIKVALSSAGAGINRHVVGNVRVLQERRERIHLGPKPCEGSREVALEALDKGICGRDIELRKTLIGVLTPWTPRKATRPVASKSRVTGRPCVV